MDPGAGSDGERGTDPSARDDAEQRDTLRFSMPAAAENLGSARLVLREWLAAVRWPADDIEYVVLAVNEALTNAIEHAYAAATPGLHPSVDVYGVVQPVPDAADSAPSSHEAFTAGTGEAPWRAHIEVIDQGAWRLRNVDLHDQFRRGGRGLPMMEAVMDQVTIDVTPGGGGTRVVLIKDTVISEGDQR